MSSEAPIQKLYQSITQYSNYAESHKPGPEWTSDGYVHPLGPNKIPLVTKHPYPILRDEELKNAILGGKFSARLFNLGNESECRDYCKLKELQMQKQVRITQCQYQTGEYGQAPMVWLEWVRVYMRIPGK